MSKKQKTTDARISNYTPLITPRTLLENYPSTSQINKLVKDTRTEISNIINGNSNKFLCIIGPCSIHNIEEAKEYANSLVNLSNTVKNKMLIVMRVYFEKPRTTTGWKGLINDPNLDESYDVNKGLRMARELLIYINSIGLPCAYEILDTITPQYISDLISWGAIGARTTESQVHRQLVSGLSMPVGFKNGTGGSISIATDAVKSASHPHCFMGITEDGIASICNTLGNKDCHIILRGSNKGPNYQNISYSFPVVVDCSHDNSNKDFNMQPHVLKDVMIQRNNGNKNIVGIMIESNINEGKQTLINGKLKYGISITDSCINLETTFKIIQEHYNSLKVLEK